VSALSVLLMGVAIWLIPAAVASVRKRRRRCREAQERQRHVKATQRAIADGWRIPGGD
jgi:hypothetical protein